MFRHDNFRFRVVLLLVLLFILSTFTIAFSAPSELFSIKTDKKIRRVNIIGEGGERIFLHNKARLFVHDGNTGEKIWEVKVPSYTDDGLDLIWNDQYYITSMKKGMICYDLANGDVVWETPTNIKMKTFVDYFNFDDVFVLQFNKLLMGFNPNTGEKLWEQKKFSLSDKLWKAGVASVWNYSRDFGERLLLLGDKESTLYDAMNGNILGTYPSKFSGKEQMDVAASFGDKMVSVFCKKETFGINIEDGSEIWRVEEKVDQKRGYVTFDQNDRNYLLFGLKKKIMVFDLDAGKILWETGEDAAVMALYSYLYEDGTLAVIGFRSKLGLGTSLFGYGFNIETGEKIYGPLPLVVATNLSIFGTIQVGFERVPTEGDDWTLYVYASAGLTIKDDPNAKWGGTWKKEKGGEGFVRYNSKTGELKYRNNFRMFDLWTKKRPNAVGQIAQYNPGKWEEVGAIPQPVYDENGAAYIVVEDGFAKINLETGETIWQNSEYDSVSDLILDDGKIIGQIGWSQWDWGGDMEKTQGVDHSKRSKKHGMFVVDAASGKEVWRYPGKVKGPLGLHFSEYDPETNQMFLSDGVKLQRVDIDDKKVAWELNLKKEVTGTINAKDGVGFILTEVSHSSTVEYNITEKSYDMNMCHGIFWLDDGTMLVLAKKGPAKVDRDGNVVFKEKWVWVPARTNMFPTLTNSGLMFQQGKLLETISLDDGKMTWSTKAGWAKNTNMFFTDDNSKLFIMTKKTIECYKL
jgi:PQQ-like domain